MVYTFAGTNKKIYRERHIYIWKKRRKERERSKPREKEERERKAFVSAGDGDVAVASSPCYIVGFAALCPVEQEASRHIAQQVVTYYKLMYYVLRMVA